MFTKELSSSEVLTDELRNKTFELIAKRFKVEIRSSFPDEIPGLNGQVQYTRTTDSFLILICPAISSIERFMSTICHELGHVKMIRELKFLNYHFTPNEDASIERLSGYVRTALKAELKADSIGRKLMAFICPKMQYLSAYGSWEAQKSFRKHTVLPYKQRLDDMLLAKSLDRLAS